MKKSIILKTIVFIGVPLYLLFSFISFDFNPLFWEKEERKGLTLIFIATTAVFAVLDWTRNNK